ncbi:MAG TPA: TIGR03013 family PEP-CTERM/XrtA system glycosyltransferase [Dokdonella sp.]|nr:TIGR03013 family PEP-CTERM/XrtA system glycosyltransferase [Dokdonella sp.]MCW5569068.1 TIGR03013 family PEP-CTERM/XrtA system glycosyltransferase [Dokdonella sp.]HNR91628.1 TIGR03013 family PEP-CTERM/XrtA system glycosyltransferase [Dokdonella sp.]
MLRLVREQGARWLALLAIGECLVLAAAMVAAMHVRYAHNAAELALHSAYLYPRALLFGFVLVTAFAALGLYQPRLRDGWFGVFARVGIGFVLGGTASVILYYLVPQAYVGRGVLGIALVIGFPLVLALRAAFMRLVNVEALKRRVLVLGSGERAAMINSRMRRRVDRRGFSLVGFVRAAEEVSAVAAEQTFDDDESLVDRVSRLQVNEIVIALDDRRGQLPMGELLECKQRGVAVTDLITFFERELGKVKLSLIDPSWMVFSDGFDASPLRRFSKRAFDIVASALVLVLTWPLMLGAAIAIRLESGRAAPILYRQERVGENGRTFSLIKFRSMRTDAEKDGVARWAGKDDDRVTRTGRFIRKVRIDELPQLWNILRGDMSLIGPRPERPQFVAELAKKIRYYELRHCVKPGLAGWAQLNYPYGATVEDAAEKLKYDLFYVKNHDFLLDLLILIQTVEVVLFRRGAR